MRYTDIREVKKKLRSEFKSVRRGFAEEEQLRRDRQILQRLLALPEYHKAPLVLSYVSTAISTLR